MGENKRRGQILVPSSRGSAFEIVDNGLDFKVWIEPDGEERMKIRLYSVKQGSEAISETKLSRGTLKALSEAIHDWLIIRSIN
jgi:hypothetical protein